MSTNPVCLNPLPLFTHLARVYTENQKNFVIIYNWSADLSGSMAPLPLFISDGHYQLDVLNVPGNMPCYKLNPWNGNNQTKRFEIKDNEIVGDNNVTIGFMLNKSA